ncbi:MAG: hypothetical protein FE78DRAFT_429906 [Acidomyces sp. 'richmondensis']|nr:MAG: hypothetical protein FE78DRAFT_429906 [Acidomyces sp. 'richmondensis']
MLDLSLLPEWTLPDDSAWPPISTIEVNGTQAVAEAGMSAPDADPATTFLVNNIGPGNTGPAEHHFSPSHDVERMERCFLDTVVQVQPGENRTVCSIALAMIFRNNRKGLSMGELQRRLLPGMKGSSSFSSECSIEDSILINVLADIST